MHILTISIKRNRTGCDSTSGYLRKAVQCWKDFSVRSGQVGFGQRKMNAQSEQLDLSACVLLWFIWFMKGSGAFEVSAACGELAFPAFGREQ